MMALSEEPTFDGGTVVKDGFANASVIPWRA